MRTASQLGNFLRGGSNDVVPTPGGVYFVVLCRVIMAGCILKEPKVPVLCKSRIFTCNNGVSDSRD